MRICKHLSCLPSELKYRKMSPADVEFINSGYNRMEERENKKLKAMFGKK